MIECMQVRIININDYLTYYLVLRTMYKPSLIEAPRYNLALFVQSRQMWDPPISIYIVDHLHACVHICRFKFLSLYLYLIILPENT